MAVNRSGKWGRRAGVTHCRPHSKTSGQRMHGYMRNVAMAVNQNTRDAALEAQIKKADAVLPWECARCGALWGPFQASCKVCGPLIEIATEVEYRQWMEAHESRPRRCLHGDCEAIPDDEEHFCAFHDELYGREAEQPGRAFIPFNAEGKWDGFGLFAVPAMYLGPEESIGEWRPRPRRLWSIPRPWSSGGGIAFNPLTWLRVPSEWADAGWRPGVMYSKGGQLARLRSALEVGLGLRAASREVGCSVNTTRRLHRIVLAERERDGHGPILCPCGRASTHRGWCSHRYQQSPARQRAMAELHGRQRKSA